MRIVQHTLSVKILGSITTVLATVTLLGSQAFALSSSTLISLTNNERTAAGIARLSPNSLLSSAATSKAKHMCVNNYWAHTAPDGTTGWYFMKQAGYDYRTAGENLAKGFVDDSSIVSSWMQSAGHRENILKTSFLDIGIGMYACSGDTIVVAFYGAQQVTVPTSPPPAPKSAPAPTPQPVKTAKPPVSTKITTKPVPAVPKAVEQPAPVAAVVPGVLPKPATPKPTVAKVVILNNNPPLVPKQEKSVQQNIFTTLLDDLGNLAITDFVIKRLLEDLMATNVNVSHRAVFNTLTSGMRIIWSG